MKQIFCLLLVVLPVSCSDSGGPDGITDFTEALEVWRGADIDDYDITVVRRCFCGGALMPVTLEVRGGKLVETVKQDSGEPLDTLVYGAFPTAEGLFSLWADAINRDAHDIRVTTDDDFGFPTDLHIDYEENVVDEEIGYVVAEFSRN